MDNTKTAVIFRKFKEGDIIALFPFEIADHNGNCMSYQHIGQHGAADYMGCIADTVQALYPEYKNLLNELKSIGYDLNVITCK